MTAQQTTKWQRMETAPKNGEPILLFLDPPLDTNDAVGWATPEVMHQVVGWWDGRDWICGFCTEGTADSFGFSSPLPMPVKAVRWMPLPARPEADHG